jgi:hypothetical protein
MFCYFSVTATSRRRSALYFITASGLPCKLLYCERRRKEKQRKKKKIILTERGAIKSIANPHDPQQTFYETWLLEKNNKTSKIVYIHLSE